MKRFTETTKWDDPWFWELSSPAKFLWLYLLDHCDNAGIVSLNFKLSSLKIGETINENTLMELGNRLQTLPDGKLYIVKFVQFQYGTLKPNSNLHKSVIKLLDRHKIQITQDSRDGKASCSPTEPLLEASMEAPSTVKVQVQVKEGGVGGYHPDTRTALHILNETSGSHFRELDSNLSVISARLGEPEVTLEGVRLMIERQCKRWKGTSQEEYLTPSTLFGKEKFDNYYAKRASKINSGTGTKGFDRAAGTLNEGVHEQYNLRKIQAQRAIQDAQRPAANPNA